MADPKQPIPTPGIESQFVTPVSYTTDNTPKYFCTLRFQKYDRPSPFSLAIHYDEAKYILPLPQSINDTVVSKWSGDSLNVVGDIQNGDAAGGGISAIYRQLGTLTNGLVTMAARAGLSGAAAGMGASGKGVAGMIKGAVGAVDATLPADSIQNAIESSMGIAPNPNVTLLFKGPQLREFDFRWIFYPKNTTESQTIHKMIRDIKARMLPATALLSSAALLKYPNMCIINFYPWDDDSYARQQGGNTTDPLLCHTTESIVLIKRCAITSCNVNYGPGGQQSSFYAGTSKPTVIEMTLKLSEMEYLLSNDYGRDEGLLNDLGTLIEAGAKSISWLQGNDAVAQSPDNPADENGDKPKQ